jgi:hypothetical protein
MTHAVKHSLAEHPDDKGINVCLISTYELGRQPFGLASPAAWLRSSKYSVTCLDLAVQPLQEPAVVAADLIAFYVPMHTATCIAVALVPQIHRLNPGAHICFYGLYAPLNEKYLQSIGVHTVLGGEYEQPLLALVKRLEQDKVTPSPVGKVQVKSVTSLSRQQFLTPDRSTLPSLAKYARLIVASGDERIAGYTEATRGCKHLCRHCPIVPVYQGRFRIVQQDVVLSDIAEQVEAGARHISFGDPDFFNAPGHSLSLLEKLHQHFPDVTYDVTIKISHLVKHLAYLEFLQDTGCMFVTSALESFDDCVLRIFDKRHTKADIIKVLTSFRAIGLTLVPTFVAFTPWTTLSGYCNFLRNILDLGLIGSVAPVQYAIRLLIPAGSKLLELDSTRRLVSDFDDEALCYPWVHPDPRMDRLQVDVMAVVKDSQRRGDTREYVFARIWETTQAAHAEDINDQFEQPNTLSDVPTPVTIPYMTEPWFC